MANNLNNLLANCSIFYQNLRGFHWKIKGEEFFELYLKFEELYNDLFIKIDDIAERILTLGYQPNHNYSDYLKIAELNEVKDTTNGINGVKEIINAFQLLLTK